MSVQLEKAIQRIRDKIQKTHQEGVRVSAMGGGTTYIGGIETGLEWALKVLEDLR